MGRLCFACAAVLAALAFPAGAQTEVKVHKEYPKLFKAAQEQGRCALIAYVTGSKNSHAEEARNYLFKSEQVKRVVNKYFVMGQIPVKEGGALLKKYAQNLDDDKPPFWLVVTPQQEPVDGGDRESILDIGEGFLHRLNSIGRKYPPVNEEDRKKANDMLQEAWKDLQVGDCYEAARTVAKLRQVVWYPPSVGIGCERLLNHIELRGEQALRRARALRESSPVQAAKAYQEIVEQFTTDLTPGEQAQKELRRLLAQNRQAARKLEEFRREERARTLLERAQAEEKKDNPRSARRFYRLIVRGYADTDSFAAASKALARLDPNYTPTTQPTTQPTQPASQPTTVATRPAATEPALSEKEGAAQSLVKIARNFHAVGLDAKAREKLMECMRQYPDTGAAKTAASLYVEWGPTSE